MKRTLPKSGSGAELSLDDLRVAGGDCAGEACGQGLVKVRGKPGSISVNNGSMRRSVLRVIAGNDPGLLACVRCLWVRCSFFLITRGAVGLLAKFGETVVVKRWSGVDTLCSDGSGITLCSSGSRATSSVGEGSATKLSSCWASAHKVDKVR